VASADGPTPGFSSAPTDDELARLFDGLLAARGIALAVSGGADSTALLFLFHRWHAAREAAPPAYVFTVDHGLRAEAAREAAAVGRIAERLGLPHRTLLWDGDKPVANLQAEARAARYRLLSEAAWTHDCDTLLIAHHADDQAETFLHNLVRGSGVYGLAGMPALRRAGPVTLRRPLIDWPKARLRAFLRGIGETWVEDPSNADPRFERARLRALEGALASEGLTRDRILKTVRQMARAAEALDRTVDDLFRSHLDLDQSGVAGLPQAIYAAAPEEIRLRGLARLIRLIGEAEHTPRLERLETLDRALATGGDGTVRTLGGTVAVIRRGRVTIGLEPGREGLPRFTLMPGASAHWAGGVSVALRSDAPDPVEVGPLGTDGWTRLAAELRDSLVVPARFIHALPAAFVDGRLLACPALRHRLATNTHAPDAFTVFLDGSEGFPSTGLSPFRTASAA
jgi:tRNA(Ile)-lysidine synthase